VQRFFCVHVSLVVMVHASLGVEPSLLLLLCDQLIQVVVGYRYAFFKNAQACYCGSSYGRYLPTECSQTCKTNESCEGSLSNAVLDTGWMGTLYISFLTPLP
jgi:hypothetical protein